MPAPKFLQHVLGQIKEVFAIQTSAGVADADKIPATNAAGVLDPSLLNGKATSAGSADANKVPILDGSGRLDASFMPDGIAAETASITASEALSALQLVQVYDATGPKMRKADATTNKPASGWVKSAVALNAAGQVYSEGKITGLTGMTPGPAYLGANGTVTSTVPTASGSIVQRVGTFVSATELIVDIDPTVILLA